MVPTVIYVFYVFNVKRLWELHAFVRKSDDDMCCSTPKGMSV
jgi:hypothetical protein